MYLIQRCSNKSDSIKPEGSFDDNYRLDYMGSAEFEFGALPASLKELTAAFPLMTWFKMDDIKNPEGESLYYLSRSRDESIETFIRQKAKSEGEGPHAKEGVWLDRVVAGTLRYQQIDLWWCIDEGRSTMWTFGSDNRSRANIALGNTRDKFIAAGKISS